MFSYVVHGGPCLLYTSIFCGKQAIDGDTAQVGPQIAEELGMAQATYALSLIHIYYLKVTNAAAQLGLGPFDNGTREDLIKSNPDIIFIPSVAYTSDGTTPATAEQLYSDPALQGVKAIANRRVYLVDSSQVMSYSQFMTRAMVSMAQNIYSM